MCGEKYDEEFEKLTKLIFFVFGIPNLEIPPPSIVLDIYEHIIILKNNQRYQNLSLYHQIISNISRILQNIHGLPNTSKYWVKISTAILLLQNIIVIIFKIITKNSSIFQLLPNICILNYFQIVPNNSQYIPKQYPDFTISIVKQ